MIYQLRGRSAEMEQKLARMKNYRHIRNLLVHTNETVDKEMANTIITYVEEICQMIEDGKVKISYAI